MRKIVYIPPEQIVGVLREAEALIASGKTVAEAARVLGISELSYRLWRQEYGEQLSRRERRTQRPRTRYAA
jgi:hypothetical protein